MNEKILSLLKGKSAYISGQEISRTLHLSRAAVWKHVEQLRRDGYAIEAVSRRGYRLVSAPDTLSPEQVQGGLGTKVFGRHVVHHAIVASTMDEAFRQGFEGAAEGTVICAESQTKGRGRLGRTWISPEGKDILFSVILRPSMPVAEASRLTLIFAVGICEALHQAARVEARIKWPNDVLMNGKKIAGILTELNAEMDRVHFVAVGIGLNVNQEKHKLLRTATSVFVETGRKVSRVALFQEVLRRCEENYFLFLKEGFTPIAQKWRKMSDTLGRHVRVIEGKNSAEGLAVDIDSDGGLLIRTAQGKTIKKLAGEVAHLR